MAKTNFIQTDCRIKIIKWKIREGYRVFNGQIILLFEILDGIDKKIKRLKSTNVGIVKKIFFEEGELVEKCCTLLELDECNHTTVIKDMCADCGADLRQNENGNVSEASVPMIHSVPELKVTQKLAQKLGQADTERLLRDKKLVLLVDLDQTLIHTTNDNVPNNLKDVYHFRLYGNNSPWYHTRLRPGTSNFLKNVAPYFELHICTFGARNYAHMIVTFLDEDGKYFSHRILSRDECFNATSKTDNLKALFPCGDSLVCIIDDREDVWNLAPNLIQVKPYHFFQHTGDINAPPGLSKTELDGKGISFNDSSYRKNQHINLKEIEIEDNKLIQENRIYKKDSSEKFYGSQLLKNVNASIRENATDLLESDSNVKNETSGKTSKNNENEILIEIEDSDDYLLYLEQILKKIHKRFYEIYDFQKKIADLKILIPEIRLEVLSGKNLVFSGLIPNHMKLEQSKAFLIAKSMGANVTQNLTNSTTHLIAVTSGTFKVNAARKRSDVTIVTPDWLWTCAERWESVDERLYPLDPNKPSKMRQPPPHCHSPEHAVTYNEKSDSCTDFEPKFIDTINPLLSFSNADIAEMNQEFIQFFESDGTSSDDDPIDIEKSSIRKASKKRKWKEESEFGTDTFTALLKSNESRHNNLQFTENISEGEMKYSTAKKHVNNENDCLSEESDDPNDEDDGDLNTMGAALEREFLGLN